MKKIIIILATITIIFSFISGCTEVNDIDKFIGFWETNSDYWPYQISFSDHKSKFYYDNESYDYDSINFTYTIFENNVIYFYTQPGEYTQQINFTLNYSFSENNNVLTLINTKTYNYNDSNPIGIYHRIK